MIFDQGSRSKLLHPAPLGIDITILEALAGVLVGYILIVITFRVVLSDVYMASSIALKAVFISLCQKY
jgi:hypothetical protein